jgi:conjugal transfer/entry exclusion protein
MTTAKRTEQDVLQELSGEERQLLKRVLEIERAKLHAKAADPTDDLLSAVKAIVP